MTKVLCVYREDFNDNILRPIDGRTVNSFRTTFQPRDETESSPIYRQLIPYCVFIHNNRVAYYQRGDESERRLDPYISIGYGGHIDEADKANTVWSTVLAAAKREMKEELPTSLRFNPFYYLLLNNDEDDVSKAHTGIILLNNIPKRKTKFFDMTDIREQSELKLENWSKLVMKYLWDTKCF